MNQALLIESAQNPRFQTWKSLLKSAGIKEHGLFLLSGEKLIREFTKKSALKVRSELRTKNMTPTSKTNEQYILSSPLFEMLDVVGTHFPLLVVEVPEIPACSPHAPSQGIEVVAPLGDPNNLGALIRSSVAFGVSKVILTEESAHPFLPKTIKASAGAVFNAPLFTSGALQTWDSPQNWTLDLEGVDLKTFKAEKSMRLIVGEEGLGTKKLTRTQSLKIPTQGVESLNATVAVSIALWEISKNRGL